MFSRLGSLVSKYWLVVIVAWIAALIVVRLVAPNWDDITHDGDLAYLPKNMPSVVGEQLLATAFPYDRAKSQIVVVAARDEKKLVAADLYVLYDLARRYKNLHGVAAFERSQRLTLLAESAPTESSAANGGSTEEPDPNTPSSTGPPTNEAPPAGAAGPAPATDSPAALPASEELNTAGDFRRRAQNELDQALIALDDAAAFDEKLAEVWDQREANESIAWRPSRLAVIYHNRSLLHQKLGNLTEARDDRRRAGELDATLREATEPLPREAADLPLLDVWTWRDPYFGEKLSSSNQHARLIVLQLSNEFMATDNIRVLELVEAQLQQVQQDIHQAAPEGLQLGLSGAAAVGGDILRASAEAIHNTEIFTIILVVGILCLIYRSPLLVAVPLVSITVALLFSTSLVALLTQLNQVEGFGWWNLKVFTTTKIFIVVILFGAGTDYCLFLFSRYREELEVTGDHRQAIAKGPVRRRRCVGG